LFDGGFMRTGIEDGFRRVGTNGPETAGPIPKIFNGEVLKRAFLK
jgi:hypothetical protein